MNKSVATYANPNIESMGSSSLTPLDTLIAKEEAREEIIAAMQRNFTRPLLNPINPIKPLLEVVSNDPVMSTVADELSSFAARRALAEAMWSQKQMLYRNFGRFLPDDEKKIVNTAKDGLDGIDDRLSAVVYAIDKVKSRKAWKKEQSVLQKASHCGEAVTAKKVMTNDGYKWVDATIHELPPQDAKVGHAPAYYAIKLPDGNVINLGAKTDKFSAKLNRYPSQAMQNIATRLGIKMRGGDTAILNVILNADMVEQTNGFGEKELCYKYLPSYTSVWSGKAWIVYVGWKLNPKCTPSSYWVDSNDELTQMPVEGVEPLTLSQLDYKLLCNSSDLAVTDENNEVVEFMNEEEEFLTMFPQRETDETFVDFSKYCEDDEEMELFQACSAVIDRSEGGITLGDLESSQFVEGYLHKGILQATRILNKMKAQEQSPELDVIIANMQEHLARLNRLDSQWNNFIGNAKWDHLVKYWYPNIKNRMMCMSSLAHAKMMPAIIPNAHLKPANRIETQLTSEVTVMPEHRVVTFKWLNAISTKLMAKRERMNRKAQVLASIEAGTLEVELAFSRAFEEALRA